MNDVKKVNWERENPKSPKKKIILFKEFKHLKGASFRYRIKSLRWDIRDAFHRAIYGYEPTAVFAIDTVFVERYLEIMKQFKYGYSYPGEMTYEEWQDVIQKMIDLLEVLGADEPHFVEDSVYDREGHLTHLEKMNRTKEEFFELFSLFFFDLWD